MMSIQSSCPDLHDLFSFNKELNKTVTEILKVCVYLHHLQETRNVELPKKTIQNQSVSLFRNYKVKNKTRKGNTIPQAGSG